MVITFKVFSILAIIVSVGIIIAGDYSEMGIVGLVSSCCLYLFCEITDDVSRIRKNSKIIKENSEIVNNTSVYIANAIALKNEDLQVSDTTNNSENE